jgi:hypothetical protein
MHKLFEERLCSGCTHLVLKGVACDWRPGECPYLKAEKQDKGRGSMETRLFHITALAITEEFDAIRSVN